MIDHPAFSVEPCTQMPSAKLMFGMSCELPSAMWHTWHFAS